MLNNMLLITVIVKNIDVMFMTVFPHRSHGFSSLFVLSKADLQATIKDYPEAQEILKKKAK